jgi:hypothetical protein
VRTTALKEHPTNARVPCLAFLVSFAATNVQAQSIAITSADLNGSVANVGVFNVTNNGNKPLVSITFIGLPNSGGITYQAKQNIVAKIPTIALTLPKQTCNFLAILEYKDGDKSVTVCSPLLPNVLSGGPKDDTDYGTLSNNSTASGNDLDEINVYTPSAGWKRKDNADVTAFVYPTVGGTYYGMTSKNTGGLAWIATFKALPNGNYNTYGFLQIVDVNDATNVKAIASKNLTVGLPK